MNRAAQLALAFLLAGLLLTPTPTRASSLSYSDQPGDATAIGDTDLPRPSDPQLDLLEISWSTTADELAIDTRVGELDEPVASNGWAVAHYLD